jgi:hypothetical protein
MRILMLYNLPSGDQRQTVVHHIHALDRAATGVDVTYYNVFDDLSDPRAQVEPLSVPERLRDRRFDAAVLHYTFLAVHWDAEVLLNWKRVFAWVSELQCLKVAIPQDEPDHCELLDEWLFAWKIDVLFSVHFRPERPFYPLTRRRAKIVNCLPGYIDEVTAARLQDDLPPTSDRKVDIFYRARDLPFAFGSAGRVKGEVGRRFAHAIAESSLTADISVNAKDVLLGDLWFKRLSASKATVGAEGGYSTMDFRGEIKARSALLLLRAPTLSFEKFSELMPSGWDSHAFFTITPRHFDAIITKTCQILIEGEYGGILEPYRHYLPIRRDFSNIEQVIAELRDTEKLSSIADCAYKDILLSGKYGYSTFGSQLVCTIANVLRETSVVPSTSQSENVIDALQRELIAARHHADLMETKLAFANKQVGELSYRVNELTNTISKMNSGRIAGEPTISKIDAGLVAMTSRHRAVFRSAMGVCATAGLLVLIILLYVRYR